MNLREFETWLDAYGRAWETGDPEAATDLFAEDATYRETPFDEPCRGRGEILRYWSDVPRLQENVSFSYKILSTTDDAGIALHGVPRVVAQTGREGELAWTSA